MNFATNSDVTCGNAGSSDLSLSGNSSTQIQADLSFSFTFNGGVQSGDPDLTNITMDYAVNGKLDTSGNATGTLSLNRFSFDYKGTHYDCNAARYAWQARAGA